MQDGQPLTRYAHAVDAQISLGMGILISHDVHLQHGGLSIKIEKHLHLA
jgi:hypothetical protein